MTGENRISWARNMRLGLGVLRLSPEAFWAMTPREFDAAVRGAFGELDHAGPMTAGALDSLMQKFPDRS